MSGTRSFVRGSLAALVLAASAGACGTGSLEAGSAGSSPSASASVAATPSPTPLPSATVAAAPTILVTASPVPTAAPATATVAPTTAPTQPPPPPPASTPIVKAVPMTGTRGTTFVFQLAGFPASVDMVMTVTGPDGKTSAPTVVPIAANGAGLATYATKLSDPTGAYIAVFKNGGVVVQIVFQLV
ncbi:MAG: hypothetical protein KGN00_09470 [Chloroflexota bacterium]|nr:hypothetical protein [Chloroflexota bacterium]MDE3193902.1 hypothetical protein [Chloroflexota bacterium]